MLKKTGKRFYRGSQRGEPACKYHNGRSYTDSGGSRQVGIILEFDSWNSKIINDKLADTINRIFELE